MPEQLALPGFAVTPEYTCCLCGKVKSLFGQVSPIQPWAICRECSIAHPYPVELFVPSTRRNADKEPLMIDPSAPAEKRELRVMLDEMIRCALDPSRLDRPVVKFNLSGLELRNPVRRSKVAQYQRWHNQAIGRLAQNQMRLPYCERCGAAHDRYYEILPGRGDYWSKCQRCADEESVEALFRHRGIFGRDDVESIMDRLYKSHRELFDRGVLPDYWFSLAIAQQSA
ncbi:hypothetical protein HC928_01395 [bacterium]|nr:hypothetical protein [bacterium]